jgi:membrane protein implicated in regulation of membrane protease activity
MEFEIWHIWLMVSIIFFILEIFIPSFVVFNLGVGALFASLIAATGASAQWQFFVFSVFTLASFFLVRPALKRWAYRRSDKTETNVNAMIGRTGMVIEKIDPVVNTGLVKIDGDIWQAITADGSAIEAGKIVKVKKLDSIILTVEQQRQH